MSASGTCQQNGLSKQAKCTLYSPPYLPYCLNCLATVQNVQLSPDVDVCVYSYLPSVYMYMYMYASLHMRINALSAEPSAYIMRVCANPGKCTRY